uniref:Uncharacterized protein n=1 Tax=Ananas comosus var. bracteatus TaxID=296719 RepID=A0A6V7PSZ4_ANACO|nr:unnamed protein product [Ananas comosus var. bracteatus]
MDIFIPEDYVRTRREIKRQQSQTPAQQKQKLQIQIFQVGSHDGSPLPTPRDSPSSLASATAAGAASSPAAAFASAAARFPKASAEGRAFSTDHLFDCFKPY